MPRPPIPRRVGCLARGQGFRPIDGPACKADARSIGLDEIEAIRLADVEGLYQDAAAQRMGVSRQTYARILTRGRRTVAECLVDRRMLLVHPGPVVEEPGEPLQCPVHGGPRRFGRSCHCPEAGGGHCERGQGCRECGCARRRGARNGGQ